jgi:hypothetical protein
MDFEVGTGTMPLWISDLAGTAFGCSEQYQVCGQDLCTDLRGLYQISNDNDTIAQRLRLNDLQSATLSVIWRALLDIRTSYVFNIFGQEMFRANERMAAAYNVVGVIESNSSALSPAYYLSTTVSNKQWQLEVQNIQNAALAFLQRSVVDYAAPPNYITGDGMSTKDYLSHPTTISGRDLCSRQKVRSLAFSSFSVFGLAFILVTGSVIIILAQALPTLVEWRQTLSGMESSLHRRDEWRQSDVLHLLRAASEAQNPGVWTDPQAEIPTTIEFGQKLKPVMARPERLLENDGDNNNGESIHDKDNGRDGSSA